MGVYKNEKNKTWYFKSHYKDITGKYKYITRRGFKTKSEAKKAEADFVLNQKKQVLQSNNMTLNELYNEYYEYKQPRIKESTLITDDNKVQLHILPYFGKKKLLSITVHDINEWPRRSCQWSSIIP